MRIAMTIIAVLAIAGCNKEGNPAESKSKLPPPAEPAPEASRPKPAKAAALTVTSESVAGIRADTNAYEDLAALFPGYEIEKSSFSAEGDDYDLFLVKKDGEVLLEVEPGTDIAGVSTVAIKSNKLATPAGARVGDPIEKVMKADKPCFVGAEQTANAYCEGESDFIYVVSTAGLDNLDPEAKLEVSKLAGKKLIAIRWLPKQPEEME